MVKWGTRVARGGCWFSWKNLEDLVAIFEDALPDGQLTVRYSKDTPKDEDELILKITETREWADLRQLRVYLGSEPAVTAVQIERTASSGPQKITFKIGDGRFDSILDEPYLAATRIEGGTDVWEEGVARRVGAVFNQARFLGQRLTKWFSRLSGLCLVIALWSLIYEPSGTAGLVGAGAALMAFVLFRTHYKLTRSMLIHQPRGIRKRLVARSRNHAATSGPTPAAVLIGVLAGVAGIISTIVALLDYFFPRS
ncbi:hypothetical protein ACFVEN_26140 [Streptomyces sp. NPDC057681]|uniref:hypothetical protein n=1 Tax=Streptomyces sp. NPDC057681 TaxID=3346209 RepID=UPI0036AC3DBB